MKTIGKRFKTPWYKKLRWDRIFWCICILVIAIIMVHIKKESKRNEENTLEEHLLNVITEETQVLENKINDLDTKIIETEKKVTSRSSSERTVKSTTNQYKAVTATAYCACAKCCGKTNGITASGTKATAGRTIAASSSYKFGTKIEIKGMGTYTVEDRGDYNIENRGYIDIFFNTHEEALKFGKRTVYIKVL